jgi:hypothetical protein
MHEVMIAANILRIGHTERFAWHVVLVQFRSPGIGAS